MTGRRGRFLVVEGGEGAGKSTQADILGRRLGAVVSREPGGTPLGERIRAVLLDPALGDIDPRAELLLMVAARAEHVARVVEPALASGRDVVCDRFSGSTLAYQGYGRGLPLDEVRAACALATGGLEPDLTVLLTVGPATAARRRGGEPDRIEAADRSFHERVSAGFAELAALEGWVVVDGELPVDDVAAAIGAAVERAGAPARAARGR